MGKSLDIAMVILRVFLIANLIIILSCNRKVVPVITNRQAPPPQKTQFIYPPIATIAADTSTGKRLFNLHCNRCHGLPLISQFNAERWETILPLMFPRSRFNNEEALHVRAYVLANAVKQ
jgi:cytochrome c